MFLSGLFSDPKSKEFKVSYKKLSEVDEKIAKKIFSHNKYTKGYVKLLISGSNDSLKNKLAEIIFQKLKNISLKDDDSELFLKLQTSYQSNSLKQSDIVSLISLLDKVLKDDGFSGILLIFDELGKFIEYEVAKRENNDLHVLQMLAEYSRSPKTNLIFLDYFINLFSIILKVSLNH